MTRNFQVEEVAGLGGEQSLGGKKSARPRPRSCAEGTRLVGEIWESCRVRVRKCVVCGFGGGELSGDSQ